VAPWVVSESGEVVRTPPLTFVPTIYFLYEKLGVASSPPHHLTISFFVPYLYFN